MERKMLNKEFEVGKWYTNGTRDFHIIKEVETSEGTLYFTRFDQGHFDVLEAHTIRTLLRDDFEEMHYTPRFGERNVQFWQPLSGAREYALDDGDTVIKRFVADGRLTLKEGAYVGKFNNDCHDETIMAQQDAKIMRVVKIFEDADEDDVWLVDIETGELLQGYCSYWFNSPAEDIGLELIKEIF